MTGFESREILLTCVASGIAVAYAMWRCDSSGNLIQEWAGGLAFAGFVANVIFMIVTLICAIPFLVLSAGLIPANGTAYWIDFSHAAIMLVAVPAIYLTMLRNG